MTDVSTFPEKIAATQSPKPDKVLNADSLLQWHRSRSVRQRSIVLGTLCLLVISFLAVTGVGAVSISWYQLMSILAEPLGLEWAWHTPQQALVFWEIRLPRVVGAVFIGAALASSGAAMQSLFRNPLVEPALMGVSGGAALMAVWVMVFGHFLIGVSLKNLLGVYILPVAAFTGGVGVTLLAYQIAGHQGRTGISTLILAGVALNALAGAAIGLTLFFADDAAIRSFTFWSMGSLGSLNWSKLAVMCPIVVLGYGLIYTHSNALNAFALGEREAYFLGYRVQRVKRVVILSTALSVGATVAVAGVIGFMGLVVPHLVRMSLGAENKQVLRMTALVGALLMLWADLLARVLVAPAELPLGIVTSFLGAPFFIVLLFKYRKQMI
ncbi:MAG TPA: iron ABC transporter permease [Microscillaceae bacterium]|nr:iron ABC transporter permease [Microscillaceae bacterium]